MAKKDKEQQSKPDLEKIFAKYPPSHSVSFTQLKDILSSLVNGDDEATEATDENEG
jgi:hypothetical protein